MDLSIVPGRLVARTAVPWDRPGEGAPAGSGSGSGSGTGEPGSTSTGTGTTPQYVTVEDFSKVGSVIAGIRKTLDTLSSGLMTPDKLAELGLLEKAEDGTFRPKSAQKPQTPAKTDEQPWKAEIDKLTKQLEAANTEKKSLLEKQETSALNSALVAAFSKAGAIDPDFVAEHPRVRSKVVKNDEGKYVVKGTDKFGQESETSLDEFAEAFLKEKPEYRKAASQAGSGTPPAGSTGKTASGATIIPKAKWADMDWMMRNRDKFLSGEYVRGEN